MYTAPAVSVFKAYFTRDFSYAPDSDADNLAYVTDADIEKAYDQAVANFNDSLFEDDITQMVFLWLSAFYLVYDLQTSSHGISSQANFPISSKSVGNVSVGYTVPEQYAKDPFLSVFTGNGYGLKYLSYLVPRLRGNFQYAGGGTNP